MVFEYKQNKITEISNLGSGSPLVILRCSQVWGPLLQKKENHTGTSNSVEIFPPPSLPWPTKVACVASTPCCFPIIMDRSIEQFQQTISCWNRFIILDSRRLWPLQNIEEIKWYWMAVGPKEGPLGISDLSGISNGRQRPGPKPDSEDSQKTEQWWFHAMARIWRQPESLEGLTWNRHCLGSSFNIRIFRRTWEHLLLEDTLWWANFNS